MEPVNDNPLDKDSDQDDKFMKALKKMETRITDTLTRSMKDMINPLQASINSLVASQKDWEQQKQDVKKLLDQKVVLNDKIRATEERNEKLESRVKKLEDHLKECNLVMHGVKDTNWELDSIRHELVIKEIAETVNAATKEEKVDITRKIPITSTSCIGKYNSPRSQPIRASFACKADADLLLKRNKKLKQGIYVDREYSDEDERE